MNTVTKICGGCKTSKPLTHFYVRSGCSADAVPGHYLTECKTCMKKRSKKNDRLPVMKPRILSEALACDYLHSQGIPALPGKSIGYADVDIAAYGCIPIEVKYARYEYTRSKYKFKWATSVRQQQRGFLADAVLLICDWQDEGDTMTFHLFAADDPVFYMDGRLKTGFTWTPGNKVALKHGNSRVVMVDGMMTDAKDNIEIIYQRLEEVKREVANGNLYYQRFSRMDHMNSPKGGLLRKKRSS